jgi:serine/threonine protein kinase
MPHSPGQKIGAYEVVSPLGAGGMGEVYRARDSKLKRDVAIKVLPADVANDRERLARFQREAEVLASLNHPHIAQVYGFENPPEGGHHLVMELVDGEDLSVRLRRGPIPLDEALPMAQQIAEALEAAHDAGIVHRDLKPGNIQIKDDGTVKVLDFGLARAAGPTGAASAAVANSPTITSPAMTMQGVILGTAAYMSPEQAKGRVVDRRADIWAFGCVLYEMLTGTRAFKGEDVTDIVTAVMRDSPAWNALPPGTPRSLRTLLERCLEKDPRKRAPHIGIARMEIADAMSSRGELVVDASVTSPPRRAWPLAIGVGLAMAMAASAVTLILTRRETSTTPAPVLRYSLALPSRTAISSSAVSPDGRFVLIAGRDDNGNRRIWLRPLDGTAFTTLATPTDADYPFWSSDGNEVAFFADKKLFRVSIGGGTPQQIADAGSVLAPTNTTGSFAAWGEDGTILFGAPDGIYRVSPSGGPIERVTPATAPPGITQWSVFHWPQWLPGQRGVLYSTRRNAFFSDQSSAGALIYQPLRGTPAQLAGVRSRALVTAHGVVVARESADSDSADLRLHQFDAAAGVLDEPGVVLAADASLNFSASNGVLVYRRGSPGAPFQFEWVGPAGQSAGDAFDVVGTGPFSLSKDESQLAFVENGTIKVRDLARGVTALLVKDAVETVFSPDGHRIAYSQIGLGKPRIVVQSASGGAAEVVYESDLTTIVEDWSSDGKYLVANQAGRRGLIIPLDRQQPPVAYAEVSSGTAAVDEARFSPDGRWLIYNAAENGRHEVFLVPLPLTGERWQVSPSGGSQGRWRRDGRAIYYLANDGALMTVDVNLATGGRPGLGRPRKLFATGLTPTTNIDQYAPNADGTRFLLRRPRGSDSVQQLEVIANWPALVKAGTQR